MEHTREELLEACANVGAKPAVLEELSAFLTAGTHGRTPEAVLLELKRDPRFSDRFHGRTGGDNAPTGRVLDSMSATARMDYIDRHGLEAYKKLVAERPRERR